MIGQAELAAAFSQKGRHKVLSTASAKRPVEPVRHQLIHLKREIAGVHLGW